jgi:hypothetical protein
MRFSIFIFLLICSFFTFGCSSTDNCTKTITIPELIIISPSGSSYNPAYTQQVPCDYIVTPVTENTTELKNFSYEVLSFKFTPDTGKNTSRLQFEIKLNNPNNYNAVGIPIITMNVDGVIATGNFTSTLSSPCNGIIANSSCILTYDKETSLNIGLTKSIVLVSVKYIVTN